MLTSCEADSEASHSFQLIASSDLLLLYTALRFQCNVTYRVIDAMKIPPDPCRVIKEEATTSSRTFKKEWLDFGTKIFCFLLGKSDKDDDNTNFVKSLTHRDMKLPFIDKLYFRCKIQNYMEHKLSEVQSSLQLPPAASTYSFFCPISFAHVSLQQVPVPQVILLLHMNITINQALLRSRHMRYVYRESHNPSCCTLLKYCLMFICLTLS